MTLWYDSPQTNLFNLRWLEYIMHRKPSWKYLFLKFDQSTNKSQQRRDDKREIGNQLFKDFIRDKILSSEIFMKNQSSTQNCAPIKDQADITNETKDFPQSCSDTETDCKDKEEHSKDFSSISQDISQNVTRVELSQNALSKPSIFNECTESSDLSNQYNKDPLRHMYDKSESSIGQSCIDITLVWISFQPLCGTLIQLKFIIFLHYHFQ